MPTPPIVSGTLRWRTWNSARAMRSAGSDGLEVMEIRLERDGRQRPKRAPLAAIVREDRT
jgi:hypothetical protein